MTSKHFVDPYYTTGAFFERSKGAQDAQFKVQELQYLLVTYLKKHPQTGLEQVADVGCGTGDTTLLLSKMLVGLGQQAHVRGYDIHPAMQTLQGNENVSFHYSDFTQTDLQTMDMVVLFDVIEHIPDTLSFLRAVAQRTCLVALHIPLDDSWLMGMRNSWCINLTHPGHILVLNIASAVNLLTFSGLRIDNYRLTPVFRAPSGKETRPQRLLNPIRNLLFHFSPYVLQKTLGGISLMVLATTAHAHEK